MHRATRKKYIVDPVPIDDLTTLSIAPDETTPTPRLIEQPPQLEIPMKQLNMFEGANDVSTELPDPLTLLRKGAALVLSISGGRDSDAMSHHLLDLRDAEGWSGETIMIHADLGSRVEWHQTPEYVRSLVWIPT